MSYQSRKSFAFAECELEDDEVFAGPVSLKELRTCAVLSNILEESTDRAFSDSLPVQPLTHLAETHEHTTTLGGEQQLGSGTVVIDDEVFFGDVVEQERMAFAQTELQACSVDQEGSPPHTATTVSISVVCTPSKITTHERAQQFTFSSTACRETASTVANGSDWVQIVLTPVAKSHFTSDTSANARSTLCSVASSTSGSEASHAETKSISPCSTTSHSDTSVCSPVQMQCTKEAVGHVLRVSAPRSQVDFQNILDTIEAMSVDYTKQNLNSTLPNSPSLKSATPKGIEMPNTTLMTESKLIDQQTLTFEEEATKSTPTSIITENNAKFSFDVTVQNGHDEVMNSAHAEPVEMVPSLLSDVALPDAESATADCTLPSESLSGEEQDDIMLQLIADMQRRLAEVYDTDQQRLSPVNTTILADDVVASPNNVVQDRAPVVAAGSIFPSFEVRNHVQNIASSSHASSATTDPTCVHAITTVAQSLCASIGQDASATVLLLDNENAAEVEELAEIDASMRALTEEAPQQTDSVPSHFPSQTGDVSLTKVTNSGEEFDPSTTMSGQFQCAADEVGSSDDRHLQTAESFPLPSESAMPDAAVVEVKQPMPLIESRQESGAEVLKSMESSEKKDTQCLQTPELELGTTEDVGTAEERLSHDKQVITQELQLDAMQIDMQAAEEHVPQSRYFGSAAADPSISLPDGCQDLTTGEHSDRIVAQSLGSIDVGEVPSDQQLTIPESEEEEELEIDVKPQFREQLTCPGGALVAAEMELRDDAAEGGCDPNELVHTEEEDVPAKEVVCELATAECTEQLTYPGSEMQARAEAEDEDITAKDEDITAKEQPKSEGPIDDVVLPHSLENIEEERTTGIQRPEVAVESQDEEMEAENGVELKTEEEQSAEDSTALVAAEMELREDAAEGGCDPNELVHAEEEDVPAKEAICELATAECTRTIEVQREKKRMDVATEEQLVAAMQQLHLGDDDNCDEQRGAVEAIEVAAAMDVQWPSGGREVRQTESQSECATAAFEANAVSAQHLSDSAEFRTQIEAVSTSARAIELEEQPEEGNNEKDCKLAADETEQPEDDIDEGTNIEFGAEIGVVPTSEIAVVHTSDRAGGALEANSEPTEMATSLLLQRDHLQVPSQTFPFSVVTPAHTNPADVGPNANCGEIPVLRPMSLAAAIAACTLSRATMTPLSHRSTNIAGDSDCTMTPEASPVSPGNAGGQLLRANSTIDSPLSLINTSFGTAAVSPVVDSTVTHTHTHRQHSPDSESTVALPSFSVNSTTPSTSKPILERVLNERTSDEVNETHDSDMSIGSDSDDRDTQSNWLTSGDLDSAHWLSNDQTPTREMSADLSRDIAPVVRQAAVKSDLSQHSSSSSLPSSCSLPAASQASSASGSVSSLSAPSSVLPTATTTTASAAQPVSISSSSAAASRTNSSIASDALASSFDRLASVRAQIEKMKLSMNSRGSVRVTASVVPSVQSSSVWQSTGDSSSTKASSIAPPVLQGFVSLFPALPAPILPSDITTVATPIAEALSCASAAPAPFPAIPSSVASSAVRASVFVGSRIPALNGTIQSSPFKATFPSVLHLTAEDKITAAKSMTTAGSATIMPSTSIFSSSATTGGLVTAQRSIQTPAPLPQSTLLSASSLVSGLPSSSALMRTPAASSSASAATSSVDGEMSGANTDVPRVPRQVTWKDNTFTPNGVHKQELSDATEHKREPSSPIAIRKVKPILRISSDAAAVPATAAPLGASSKFPRLLSTGGAMRREDKASSDTMASVTASTESASNQGVVEEEEEETSANVAAFRSKALTLSSPRPSSRPTSAPSTNCISGSDAAQERVAVTKTTVPSASKKENQRSQPAATSQLQLPAPFDSSVSSIAMMTGASCASKMATAAASVAAVNNLKSLLRAVSPANAKRGPLSSSISGPSRATGGSGLQLGPAARKGTAAGASAAFPSLGFTASTSHISSALALTGLTDNPLHKATTTPTTVDPPTGLLRPGFISAIPVPSTILGGAKRSQKN